MHLFNFFRDYYLVFIVGFKNDICYLNVLLNDLGVDLGVDYFSASYS